MSKPQAALSTAGIGLELYRAIEKALGLPPRVRKLELCFEVGQPITAKIEQFAVPKSALLFKGELIFIPKEPAP